MNTANTRVWFPAIRAWLERKLGPWLPPHPSRVVLGAALGAVLASALWFTGVGVVYVGSALWEGLRGMASSMSQTVAELSAPPPAPPAPPVAEPPAPTPSVPVTPPAQPSPATPVAPPVPATPPAPSVPYPVITDPVQVRESIVPDALPYTESAEASLTDSVRQVDFALMQALARLGVDGSRLDVLHTSVQPTPEGAFLLQRLRLYLSAAEMDALLALYEAVQAWADEAVLEVRRGDQWLEAGKVLEEAASSAPAAEDAQAAGASTSTASSVVPLLASTPGPQARVRLRGQVSHELFITPVGKVFVPPPPDGEPRLSIIIDDMGANLDALKALLDLDLPIAVSIIPHLRHAAETAKLAHQAGNEVLVHQPMEPMQTPYVKAGPDALTVSMGPGDIAAAMNRSLAKVPFATGLNNHMGSRLTRDAAASRAVVQTAAAAGLFVLDSLTHGGSVLYQEAQKAHLTAFRRDLFLDDGPVSVGSVRKVLDQAERVARRTGKAVVIGHPRPETLAALREWAHERDASVAVVPLRYQK